MFNPTNCNAQKISAKISGSQSMVANVSSPFAVGGCKSLAFKPKFTVSTSGHTSRAKGASLDVKLSYPPGAMGNDANVASVKVDLPKILPSRLPTLQQACIAHTFETDPAACPPASIVGVARTTTPLLPVELSGPVYFVSHGGEAFPSLIIVLQGDHQLITRLEVLLWGVGDGSEHRPHPRDPRHRAGSLAVASRPIHRA